MRPFHRGAILICIPLLLSICSFRVMAQTNSLTAGDLVFSSYNNAGTAAKDSFSFIVLKTINPGTAICFSDRGYSSSTNTYFSATGLEGSIAWISGATLLSGSEVLISNNTATVNGIATGTVTIVDGTSGYGFSLQSTDQLFAYQNSTPGLYTLSLGSTLISGIHWNRCISGSTLVTNDNIWDPAGNCTVSTAPSQLPLGLTPGSSALYVGEVVGGFATQQASYSCSGVSLSNAGAVRAAVYNSANWLKSNATDGSLPTPSGCTNLILLPVELISFTAAKQVGNSLLTWQIARENNISTYTIERSADGRSFITTGNVASLGNTTAARSYSFTDVSPLKGANYYRLKTKGKDGKVSYSDIRLLNWGSNISIAVYPNPAKDKATLIGVEAGMTIRLVDAAGKALRVQRATRTTESIVLSGLPEGFYSVQVYSSDGVLLNTTQVVKE